MDHSCRMRAEMSHGVKLSDPWTHYRKGYDPHRPCPKCGHHLVSSRHVTLFFGIPDAVRRNCQRCDYIWDENPLDAEVES